MSLLFAFNQLFLKICTTFSTIRFEDVAYQREQAVRKFFEHLDRPYHSRVTTYLNHHAIPKEDDGTETFITYKNTTYEPIKWLNTTNFEPVECHIQFPFTYNLLSLSI